MLKHRSQVWTRCDVVTKLCCATCAEFAENKSSSVNNYKDCQFLLLYILYVEPVVEISIYYHILSENKVVLI